MLHQIEWCYSDFCNTWNESHFCQYQILHAHAHVFCMDGLLMDGSHHWDGFPYCIELQDYLSIDIWLVIGWATIWVAPDWKTTWCFQIINKVTTRLCWKNHRITHPRGVGRSWQLGGQARVARAPMFVNSLAAELLRETSKGACFCSISIW